MIGQSSEDLRSCYDTVAREYAEHFVNELAGKPLDRELLARFASTVRGLGTVYDLGCGPGQTTAFLHNLGVTVRGLDLSHSLVCEAQQRHPGIPFEAGDMLALPLRDAGLAGVVAFYAIVHFSPPNLQQAFTEMYRVLRPGGQLLLAFHIGEGSKLVDEFLGHPIKLEFAFFDPQLVGDELVRAGFGTVEIVERDPYPDVEYPSRRAYVFAQKPDSDAP